MVLYGTSWDFLKSSLDPCVHAPFVAQVTVDAHPLYSQSPWKYPKNIQKLTKQTCQPHLSKVLSIFKGPGKGSTHVFDTRILHLSAFTSLASVFPRIHRISVQPSQETLKDHHAVCKIYHLMLLMDKILQTN